MELWRASGRSAVKVATELGIRPPLLYRWARTELPPTISPSRPKRLRNVEELEAEIRRLRAENTKLLEQREVLKKSLGIPSEVPPRGMPGSIGTKRPAPTLGERSRSRTRSGLKRPDQAPDEAVQRR